LHELLQQENASIAIAAPTGMGGIGKTELALQYAYRHLEDYPAGVCWISVRQSDLAVGVQELVQICFELVPPDILKDSVAKVQWCYQRWLEQEAGQALLVLDDVLNSAGYEQLQPYLPKDSRFRVLVTTREQLQSPVKRLELSLLSPLEAYELLYKYAQDQATESDKRWQSVEAQIAAEEICKGLGYLPLGLELVGRHLATKLDLSLEVLWQRLQQQGLDAKALLRRSTMMAAHESIVAAFELSWQELSPPAQQLASFLSLFALAPIPWSLVEACLIDSEASSEAGGWDGEALEESHDQELLRLHLLQRMSEGSYQLSDRESVSSHCIRCS
jgi:hypothetical protein